MGRRFWILFLVVVVTALCLLLVLTLLQGPDSPAGIDIAGGSSSEDPAKDEPCSDPELAAEPARQPVEGPDELIGSTEVGGTVLVLDLASSGDTAGTEWVLESDLGRLRRVADSRGRFRVPAGDWLVSPSEESVWHPASSMLHVSPQQITALWVMLPYGIRVRAVSTTSDPVVGALVRWLPMWTREGAAFWERPTVIETRTNETGLACFSELTDAAGDLCILANGFDSRRLELSGCAGRDLEVTLVPSVRGPRFVTFVAEQDGVPLSGVSLVSTLGEVPGESDGSGRLQLPCWLDDNEWIHLHGEEILEVEASAGELTAFDVVHLALRSTVTIEVIGYPDVGQSTGCNWTCLIDVQKWPTGCFGIPVKPGMGAVPAVERWVGSRSAPLPLPRGMPTELSLIGSEGMGCALVVRPMLASESISLTATKTRGLTVSVTMSKNLGSVATLSANMGLGQVLRQPVVHEGEVLVPFPERASRLTVRAHGYVPMTLIPVSGIEPSGRIDLTLDQSRRIRVRVSDGQGRPLSGMSVEFSEVDTLRDRSKDPSGPGLWTTNHPAWAEMESPSLRGVADLRGEVVLDGFRNGEYLAWITKGAIADGFRGRMNLALILPETVQILPRMDSLDLRVPDLRWHSIRVIDRYSVSPIEGLFVSSPQGLPSQIVRADGDVWEGWIPVDWTEIDVGAEGHDAVRLGQRELSQTSDHVVLLEPTEGCLVQIDGKTESLEGVSVHAEILQFVTGAQGSYWSMLGRTSAALRRGELQFGTWPVDRRLRIRLTPIEHDGQVWSFNPADFPLTPHGATTSIRRGSRKPAPEAPSERK